MRQTTSAHASECVPPGDVALRLPRAPLSAGDTAGDFAANGEAAGSCTGANGEAAPGHIGAGGGILSHRSGHTQYSTSNTQSRYPHTGEFTKRAARQSEVASLPL